MVDFSKTGLTELPNVAQVRPGIVDEGAGLAMNAASGLIKGSANFFEQQTAAKNDAGAANLLSQHLIGVSKIADAVDQGVLSSSEAQTKLRQFTAKAIANNPGYGAELAKVSKDALEGSAFGSIIRTGTDQEQMFEKNVERARVAGFVTSTMTEDQTEKAVAAHNEHVAASATLKRTADDLLNTNVADKTELEIAQRKSRKAVQGVADTFLPSYSNKVFSAMEIYEASNKDEGDIKQFQGTMLALKREIDSVAQGSGLSKDDLDDIMFQYRELDEFAKGIVKGEYTKETLANQKDIMDKRMLFNQLQDPEIKEAYELSSIMNGMQLPLENQVAVMRALFGSKKLISGGVTPTINPKGGFSSASKENEEGKDLPAYLKFVKIQQQTVVKDLKKGGGVSPEQKAKLELDTKERTVSLMEATGAASEGTTPKQIAGMVEHFAGADFKIWKDKFGGDIPEDVAAKAIEKIDQYYFDQLTPLVQAEFKNTNIGVVDRENSPDGMVVTKSIASSELVDVVFEGNGVRFVAKSGALPEGSRRAKAEADRLNKSISLPMNNYIRAVANIGGKTVEEIWESTVKPGMFPELVETKEGDTKEGKSEGTRSPSLKVEPIEDLPGTKEAEEARFRVPSLMERIMKKLDQNTATEEEKEIVHEAQSDLWGAIYHTEDNPTFKKRFVEDQDRPLVAGLKEGIDKALTAFVGDKGITDQTKLRALLVATAKHESHGGKKLRNPNSTATGAFQVLWPTARDVVKTSGLYGAAAEKITGKTKEEVLAMSDEELETFLKDHTASAVFGIMVYLQAADAHGRLEELGGK